jgi:hypothetical protein
MTAAEISSMIVSDSFPDRFDSSQRDNIKKLWKAGKVREAQQAAQEILEAPAPGGKKDKTLL